MLVLYISGQKRTVLQITEVKAVSLGDESTCLGESQPQAHVGCVVNDLALS